ncbi:DUF6476 family protein [Algirhabdus cladophorae]|uniref:DUF6476 family protein n=1 Tax=Algirhabdus cladophorae TaxID=3377108 RepID=UPI003B846DB3
MDETPTPVEPANIRFLRRLVTGLTAVMIVGLVVMIALFVIRFWGGAPAVTLPDQITLPDGVRVTAFTQGSDWYAVVTDQDKIMIFDRESGALRQTIAVKN